MVTVKEKVQSEVFKLAGIKMEVADIIIDCAERGDFQGVSKALNKMYGPFMTTWEKVATLCFLPEEQWDRDHEEVEREANEYNKKMMMDFIEKVFGKKLFGD